MNAHTDMSAALNGSTSLTTFKDDFRAFVFISKYSKYLDDLGRRETWEETCTRVKVNVWDRYLTPKLAQRCFDFMYNFWVMPAMRVVATAGPALDRDNMAGFNCSYKAITDITDFGNFLKILTCGTGVGFSVEQKYIEQLPTVPESFTEDHNAFVVADSKEGWQEVVNELMTRAFNEGVLISWDLSKIRPKGARLKTFGGRASGPEPLDRLLNFMKETLLKARGRKLTSLECHDMMCYVGDIVVSGGVRRSALISLSDLYDGELRDAKAGEWWNDAPYRRLANNSFVTDATPARDVFDEEWASLKASGSGERGIFNREAAINQATRFGRKTDDFGCNPCSEILLRSSGQVCNLSEVIIREDDDMETLREKVEVATIMGTVQSCLTHFPNLPEEWAKNSQEERLLGVSMTGIMDNALTNGKAYGLKERLNELRDHAIDVNEKLAAELGINKSAAITCVKPSGSVSSLCGTASGIHARHSQFYIRRVRGDNTDPLTQLMIDEGIPNEPDQFAEDTTVFSFPMIAPRDAITRHDMTALDHMALWLTYQREWAMHKVSATISVREHEWEPLADMIYENYGEVAGVSFLPHDDHTYVQAPFEDIDEDQFHDLCTKFPDRVRWERLPEYEIEDSTKSSQEMACSGGTCEITSF